MRQLEEELTWREYQEWEIYLSSHPPDGEVVDWQMATLLSVLGRMFNRAAPDIGAWSLFERMRPRTAAEVSAEIHRMFGVE